MLDIKDSFWTKAVFRQGFVITAIISLMFTAGIAVGTATVMIPQLQKSEDEMHVSDVMASWICKSLSYHLLPDDNWKLRAVNKLWGEEFYQAVLVAIRSSSASKNAESIDSVQGFGSYPVVLFLPYLNQLLGYRITYALNGVPMIMSMFLQYFATNSVHLLVAAVLQGMTMGGNLCIGVLGITEYAEPRYRTAFLIIKSASYFWGIWIANIIGTFFHWRYIPLFAVWPPLYSFCSCYFWPEGPYWLANKGRIEECKKSFLWLRGPDNGTEELASMIKAQTEKVEQKNEKTESLLRRIRKIVVLRHFYMPVCVNCVLYCLYYFTGKIVFAVYALVILKDITQSETWAYFGMLIIDAVTVVGMYIGSYVSIKVRRRSMLLTTSASTIVFLYILSIYLSLVSYQVIIQNSILSITFLIIYSFSVSWGPMVLCTAFTSEIVPMRFKPFFMTAGSIVFYTLHSATLKIAPLLFNNIGMHGTFGVFGTLTLICWLYLYIYLPETSNKTLQELETCFVKNKDNKNNQNENYDAVS